MEARGFPNRLGSSGPDDRCLDGPRTSLDVVVEHMAASRAAGRAARGLL